MKIRNAGIFIAVAVVAMMLIPVSSVSYDASSVTVDNVEVRTSDSEITIQAGSSTDTQIRIANGKTDDIWVRIIGYNDAPSGVSVSHSNAPIKVSAGGSVMLFVTVSSDKYTAAESGAAITFDIEVDEPFSATGVFTITTAGVIVNVSSSLSPGDNYNKILGRWASPFDDALYTALASAILWIILAFIISYAIMPFLLFLVIKEDKRHRKAIRKDVWKPFFFLAMLYASSNTARVYGLGEENIGLIDSVVSIAYILIGAIIAWRVYKALVRFLVHRMREKAGNMGVDGSLVPLLDLIGKLLITVTAFAGILASLGFDLMVIITGAGVLGIAISLGAQNTLSQFFNGMMLLITRPFKAGDLVKIGSNSVTMRVVNVGMLTSTFEDAGNTTIYVMPNNVVATSMITNISRKANDYFIEMFFGIDYGNDVEQAKNIIRTIAEENINVISDGSYDLPSIRLESFEDSYIKIRLGIYVNSFSNRNSIAGRIREDVFAKFKEAGISIPYPQMDVHVKKD
jgi:Small-conductance mechanosensitive channel